MALARRPFALSGAAAGFTLFLVALLPPGVAEAHSQLVSSDPGAGDTVSTAPAEVRLVFSEPVDGAYTSLDVLDSVGHVILQDAGAPDPNDAREFVAPLPVIPNGAYTISWRAISAADGHSTSGFITFAVGNASLPAGSATSGDVDPHAGHGGAALIVEVIGRTIGALGFMAAVGLALFAWVSGFEEAEHRRRLAWLATAGLALGGIGAVLLAWIATSTGLVGAANADLMRYLSTARSGQLLLLRAGVAIGGVAIGTILLWRRRSGLMVAAVAAVAGIAGLVLISLSSHAAAFASPVPLIAQFVHLVAGSAWVGGLFGLGATILLARPLLPDLRAVVPRFSAVALASVALIAASGAYLDWVETANPFSVTTQYEAVLFIKIALFLAALAFGAANYLRGADVIAGRFGFRRRVLVEAGLAVGVIAASGVLASGIPPSGLSPIPIGQAVSSAGSVLPAGLAVAPARPGPNALVATGVEVSTGDQLVLVLQRLDQAIGSTRILLEPRSDGTYVATGVSLPPDTRWDATLVLQGSDQTEVGRARFVFGLGPDGLTEGEASPIVGPAVLLGALLLLGAVLTTVFVLAGGSVPHTDRRTTRFAFLGASGVAVVFGCALLLGDAIR